jgi:hypothetical protein
MLRSALVVLAGVLLVLGCSEPRAVPIIGPDGTRMFHVSCGSHEAECYRLAGERCPYGYELGRTIAGGDNMLVRCRTPIQQPVYPTAEYRPAPPPAPPAPVTGVATLPSTPPEPSAPAPAPSASASPLPRPSSVPWPPRVPVVPTQPGRVQPGTLDLGY